MFPGYIVHTYTLYSTYTELDNLTELNLAVPTRIILVLQYNLKNNILYLYLIIVLFRFLLCKAHVLISHHAWLLFICFFFNLIVFLVGYHLKKKSHHTSV